MPFLNTTADTLVVMLQEVCRDCFPPIRDNPWIQQNFILLDVAAPESLYREIPGESFVFKSCTGMQLGISLS